ncbi:phage holin family protein [Patescibacteria group bacterium]|nr:phage holin family protein [Patescibacteria group bacterium]
MKKIARKFFIYFIALVLLREYVPIIKISDPFLNVIFFSMILSLVDTYLKPVIKTMMLPINLVTFNLASLFTTSILLFIADYFTDYIEIVPFTTPAFELGQFSFDAFDITKIYAYVVCGLLMVLLHMFISFVFKKDA